MRFLIRQPIIAINHKIVVIIIGYGLGQAIKFRVGKEIGNIAKIHDGKKLLAIGIVNARTASDDLLEFGHRLDFIVEHNQFAGFAIDAGGHQFGGSNNCRILLIRVDEIIKLRLAFGIVAGNAHNIFRIDFYPLAVFLNQRLAHALGVVNIDAKNNGFGKRVIFIEPTGNAPGNRAGALINDDIFLKFFAQIKAVFDFIAVYISFAFRRAPAFQILIQPNANHFIGCEKTVFNALL